MTRVKEALSVSADPSRCKRCEACESVCPGDVFQWRGDRIETRYPGRCILCGHCVAVCAEDALRHSGMPRERFTNIDPAAGWTFETYQANLSARRSCRRFKETPIPEETLRQLIHASRFAPTATNSQNVRFVLVDDRRAIAELEERTARYYLKLNRQLRNPLARFAIRVAVGKRSVEAYRYHLPAIADHFRAVLAKEKSVFHNAPALLIAYASGLPFIAQANCNLAAMALLLAAETLGLGTCYNGYLLTAMIRDKAVKRAAGVPREYTPGAAIAVGYPDVAFHRTPPRRKPRITGRGESPPHR